jgi:hypothetical protein
MSNGMIGVLVFVGFILLVGIALILWKTGVFDTKTPPPPPPPTTPPAGNNSSSTPTAGNNSSSTPTAGNNSSNTQPAPGSAVVPISNTDDAYNTAFKNNNGKYPNTINFVLESENENKEKKYCGAYKDDMRCDKDVSGNLSKYNLILQSDETYGLQSIGGLNGIKYCAAESDKIVCDRDTVSGPWEKFSFVKQPSGKYALFSPEGGAGKNMYCSTGEGGKISCTSSTIDESNGMFNLIPYISNAGGKIKDGMYALQSESGANGKKYCAAESNQIKCDRDALGPWEKYNLKALEDGTYTLQSESGANGKKYCAAESNQIKCNRAVIGPWEKYNLIPTA